MMRLLFKKILCPKNAGAAIGSPQPEAAAEETVFSESLSYISATSTASHCIFVLHTSTFCTAAKETVFSFAFLQVALWTALYVARQPNASFAK